MHACAGNPVHSPELVPRPKCRLFLCWSWKFRNASSLHTQLCAPLGFAIFCGCPDTGKWRRRHTLARLAYVWQITRA